MTANTFTIAWHDALDIGVEGRGWTDTHQPFDRLPKKAVGLLTDAVWNLSHSATGMSLRFRTNSHRIHARWTLGETQTEEPNFNRCSFSGLDLYGKHNGAWRWVAASHRFEGQSPEICLAEGLDGEEREYMLYFPSRNRVLNLAVGVPDDAAFVPLAPRAARPMVVYGTSIVHGAYASHAGLVYPAILGRRLEQPVINLGFSGSARMEPEMADLLGELDAAVYVLDPLPNMDLELVNTRVETFLRRLRALRPKTPIVLVEDFPRTNAWIMPHQRHVAEKCARYRTIVDGLVQDGVTGLSYVDGAELLGLDHEASIDGIHPGDLGYMRMADILEPVLAKALAGG